MDFYGVGDGFKKIFVIANSQEEAVEKFEKIFNNPRFKRDYLDKHDPVKYDGIYINEGFMAVESIEGIQGD